MSLAWKNIVLNVPYYAATVAGLPAAVLYMEDQAGFRRIVLGPLRVTAVLLTLAGVTLQVWCITLFQRAGEGTPSPLLPPRRLVLAGPYRRLRNPMNVGETLVLLALPAWFGSRALLLYALLAWLAFHLFVVFYEEPHLAATFGAHYDRYRCAAGRWLPRVRAPHPGSDPSGGTA